MKKFQRIRISLTFIVVLSTHLHLKAVLVNSHLIHTSLMSLVTNLTAVECDPQYSHRENKKPSLPQSVISLWFNSQQTSTESSNSTSRTRLIHWDNLAKQNSLVYEILVCFWVPHQDKQWCGGLTPSLEQKGKKRTATILCLDSTPTWGSQTS